MRIFLKISLIATLSALTINSAIAANTLSDEEKLANGSVVTHIIYSDGDEVANLSVRTLISASPDKVWNFLTEISRWKEWQPVMSKGTALAPDVVAAIGAEPEKNEATYKKAFSAVPANVAISSNGVTEVDTFEEFDLPWPVSNDWVLNGYRFDASGAAQGQYSVTWRQLFKGREGRGGSWKVTKNGSDDTTYFEYHLSVKRMSGVPKALFGMIMERTTANFVDALKREFAGKKT